MAGLLGDIAKALDYGNRNGGLTGLLNYALNGEPPEEAARRQMLEQNARAASNYQDLISGRGAMQLAMQAAPLPGPRRDTAAMAQAADPLSILTPQQRALLSALSPDQGMVALSNILSQKPAQEPVTDAMREFKYAVQQGYKGTFLDFKRDLAQATSSGQPLRLETQEGVFVQYPDGRRERVGSPISVLSAQGPRPQMLTMADGQGATGVGQYRVVGTGQPERLGDAPATRGTAGTLSPTVQKELFEADDLLLQATGAEDAISQALALNDKALSGIGVDWRTKYLRNAPGMLGGDPQVAADTTQFNNLILGQALESLKATFGAAPTEGERQILLQLQAAPEYSPEERKRILTRAQQMIRMRKNAAEQKAKALRDGTYFQQGPTIQMPDQTDQADEGPDLDALLREFNRRRSAE